MTTAPASAPAADYAAIAAGTGLLERPERGQLDVTGADAAEFLQGQVTNDVEALAAGEGCYAALLDPKAHIQADMRILSAGAADLWLDTEPQALEPLTAHLRMYKIGRQVEISDRTGDRSLLSLIGPASQALAERVAGVAMPGREHAWVDARVGRSAARIVITALGVDLLVEAEASATVAAALREAGARPVGPDVGEILRVEHGIPRLGVDMGAENLPGEAGIVDRAVSFTKGCYIGQEPVARMYHRGRPNRRLRGLLLSAAAAPGEPVAAAGKEVGRLGSSVTSPRLGPIALVILRREVEAGDEVLVGDGAVRATVVELPFDAS